MKLFATATVNALIPYINEETAELFYTSDILQVFYKHF